MSSNNQQTRLSAYSGKNKSTDIRPTTGSTTGNETRTQWTSESGRFKTGSTLANDYLRTAAGSEIEESSAKRYETDLRLYIRYLNSRGISPLNARVKHAKNYLREIARENLSTSTLKCRKGSLIGLYKYIRTELDVTAEMDIVALEYIDSNRFVTRDKVVKEPLSKAELGKLCDAASSRRNRLIMVVGSETGARSESLRVMKLEHLTLDSEEPSINVLNTKSGGKYSVPISDQVALDLDRWVEYMQSSVSNDSNNPYVFPSTDGGMIESKNTIKRIVSESAEEAGLQEVVNKRKPTKAERRNGVEKDAVEYHRVTPHLLRHTFSQLLEEAGLGTEARRDALDHESIQTTKKHYTHTKSEYQDLIRRLLHGADSD